MKLFTPTKSVLLMIAITLVFSGVSFADCTINVFCSDYYPEVDQPLWFYAQVLNSPVYYCYWDALTMTITSGQFYIYMSGYYKQAGTKVVVFKAITDCGYVESDPVMIYVSN